MENFQVSEDGGSNVRHKMRNMRSVLAQFSVREREIEGRGLDLKEASDRRRVQELKEVEARHVARIKEIDCFVSDNLAHIRAQQVEFLTAFPGVSASASASSLDLGLTKATEGETQDLQEELRQDRGEGRTEEDTKRQAEYCKEWLEVRDCQKLTWTDTPPFHLSTSGVLVKSVCLQLSEAKDEFTLPLMFELRRTSMKVALKDITVHVRVVCAPVLSATSETVVGEETFIFRVTEARLSLYKEDKETRKLALIRGYSESQCLNVKNSVPPSSPTLECNLRCPRLARIVELSACVNEHQGGRWFRVRWVDERSKRKGKGEDKDKHREQHVLCVPVQLHSERHYDCDTFEAVNGRIRICRRSEKSVWPFSSSTIESFKLDVFFSGCAARLPGAFDVSFFPGYFGLRNDEFLFREGAGIGGFQTESRKILFSPGFFLGDALCDEKCPSAFPGLATLWGTERLRSMSLGNCSAFCYAWDITPTGFVQVVQTGATFCEIRIFERSDSPNLSEMAPENKIATKLIYVERQWLAARTFRVLYRRGYVFIQFLSNTKPQTLVHAYRLLEDQIWDEDESKDRDQEKAQDEEEEQEEQEEQEQAQYKLEELQEDVELVCQAVVSAQGPLQIEVVASANRWIVLPHYPIFSEGPGLKTPFIVYNFRGTAMEYKRCPKMTTPIKMQVIELEGVELLLLWHGDCWTVRFAGELCN